jgi:hypothetical protein
VSSRIIHNLHFELKKECTTRVARYFEYGSRKKALERLRVLGSKKMHHFSAFRSGTLIGLGIPALADGVVKSTWIRGHIMGTRSNRPMTMTGFQPVFRETVTYWPGLYQLFGAEMLVVLFGLLFSLNLLAWHRARINYVLIFELDLRRLIDFRQFLEVRRQSFTLVQGLETN